MRRCGELLYATGTETATVRGACAQEWGVEHEHDELTPIFPVPNPGLVEFAATVLLVNGEVAQINRTDLP